VVVPWGCASEPDGDAIGDWRFGVDADVHAAREPLIICFYDGLKLQAL